jgi:hypothetical protein
MKTTVQMTVDLPLEIRATAEGDGRTLAGRIVPFGEVVDVGEGRESFAAGVFEGVDPAGVVLLWQHDQAQPIGRMTELSEESDGAYATFRLGATPRALEAASLAADGILTGLSVGFISEDAQRVDGVREHRRARLLETSLVTFPAYPTAGVLAVRNEDPMPESDTLEIPELDPVPAPDFTLIETRLADQAAELREMRNQLSNIAGLEVTVAPPMTLHRALAEALVMVAKNPSENRALADVIGTAPGNASGLIRDQYVAQILGQINALRPLFAAAGKTQFPSSGYGLQFPRITQNTLVAKRGAEKTEIPTRELTIAPANYPMEWFAGGVDVALELIAQSDPSVVEIVVNNLLNQYAGATETEFAADAVAAATVGGAVLPVADWAAFSGAVIDTSADIRVATGAPGDRLGLTTASWKSVVALLNPSQPSVSYGAGPDFTAESVNVAGITAFHAPALSADLQFNTTALVNAERPPETVTATNVALMGRDIGVLGATIAAPLYPAGIVKYTALAGRAAKE